MRAPFPSQAEGIFSHTSSRVEFLSIFGLVCENRFPAQAEGILTHSLKKLRFSMFFALVERVCESPLSLTGRRFLFTHPPKMTGFLMICKSPHVEPVCEKSLLFCREKRLSRTHSTRAKKNENDITHDINCDENGNPIEESWLRISLKIVAF